MLPDNLNCKYTFNTEFLQNLTVMVIFVLHLKYSKHMKALFDLITEEEKEILVDAISQITVLIAGADGKMQKEELEWAEKLTRIRSFSHHKSLQTFYETVGLDFHERLHQLIDELPASTQQRTEILEAKLAHVEPILQKLPIEFGSLLYHSFTSFAKHVAKSAGGFLGIGVISTNESKLMKLSMLTPIIADVEDEEEADEHTEDN